MSCLRCGGRELVGLHLLLIDPDLLLWDLNQATGTGSAMDGDRASG